LRVHVLLTLQDRGSFDTYGRGHSSICEISGNGVGFWGRRWRR